jgi:hypothetical protein
MCNCRYGNSGKCQKGEIDFACPLCKNKKWKMHTGVFNPFYVCNSCNNYVQHIVLDQISKEEFYTNDIVVVFTNTDLYHESCYLIDLNSSEEVDGVITSLPRFSFKDAADLSEKIKMYLLFL